MKYRAALISTAVLLAFGEARADTLPFVPTLSIGQTTVTNDAVRANADGSYTVAGQEQGGGTVSSPVWDLQWDLTIKQDPFIVGSLTLTNLTSSTRNFGIAFNLPITPAFSSSVFGGSVSATLIDTGSGSAALAPNTAVSPAIYRGTIDGIPMLWLLGGSFGCSGGAGCTASSVESDGLPSTALYGPGVASSIGTLLNFTLSAGDKVTFLTNFTVEPVPLPAALPMLLLGLGALGAGRLRKRQA